MDGLGLILFVHLVAESPRGIVCWQHSGRDEFGHPEILAEVEYALTHRQVDPNDARSPILRRKSVVLGKDNWREMLRSHGVPKETLQQLQKHYRADLVREDLLSPPLATGEYLIWVRVSDISGNWSLWAKTKSTVLFVDVVPPEPPTEVEYLP